MPQIFKLNLSKTGCIIHSCNKYLVNIYYVLKTILELRDINKWVYAYDLMIKTVFIPPFPILSFLSAPHFPKWHSYPTMCKIQGLESCLISLSHSSLHPNSQNCQFYLLNISEVCPHIKCSSSLLPSYLLLLYQFLSTHSSSPLHKWPEWSFQT